MQPMKPRVPAFPPVKFKSKFINQIALFKNQKRTCYEVVLTRREAQQSSCSHGSFVNVQNNGVRTHGKNDLMPTTIIEGFVREVVKNGFWSGHLQFYFHLTLVQKELKRPNI
jgi:hypothetical protein